MEMGVLGHCYCGMIAASIAFNPASEKLTLVQQAGAATILCFFSLKETYSMAILEKKTRRLRKETSNRGLRSKLDQGLSPSKAFKRAIFRPFKLLLLTPICLILSLFTAVIYGYLYLVFTTLSEVFEKSYGFSTGMIGLCFLGIGVGIMVGLVGFSAMSDRMLKAKAAETGTMKPEYRLSLLLPGAACIPIGLLIYGWTAEKRVFWFVPIAGTVFIGLGLIGVFVSLPSAEFHCSHVTRFSCLLPKEPKSFYLQGASRCLFKLISSMRTLSTLHRRWLRIPLSALFLEPSYHSLALPFMIV